MNDLEFDSPEPQRCKVRIGPKEYLLCEASAGATIKYRNATFRAARMARDGSIEGMDGLADSEAVLVGECLLEGDKPVGEAQIRAWPNRIMLACFQRVKEMSGHLEEEEDLEFLKRRHERDGKLIAALEGGESPRKNS